MKRSEKRKKAKEKHLLQKSRAKYRSVLKKHANRSILTKDQEVVAFTLFLDDLLKLHLKHLKQFYSDLTKDMLSFYIFWTTSPKHKANLIRTLSDHIFEKEVLK